jgi:molybdopterin converting factor small subunit
MVFQVTVRAFGRPKEGVRVSREDVTPGTTLEAFLAGLAEGSEPARALSGKAILLNGESVARDGWRERCLADRDVISIIPMLIGG